MDAKKPKINMTIKRLSRKQVIILMTDSNAEIIINSANQQIANINRCLKEISSIRLIMELPSSLTRLHQLQT